MDYRKAGVDIDRAAAFVERIKGAAESTRRPEWLDGLGGFGSLFRLDLGRYRKPVLVAGTDGVGTKLRLAQAMGRHDTIGIDLVAMCVNDVLVQGAEPLFFLDYLAVGKLDPSMAADIVGGIAEGCRRAGCSLVGGETAEMPGFYQPGEYDMAGFAVGVVDEDRIINGRTIKPGYQVLGLPSTGAHSNGFSLVRAALGDDLAAALARRAPWGNETVGEAFLRPTAIYVPAVLPLLSEGLVAGMAHITGGGLVDNPVRILPPGTDMVLRLGSWPVPALFDFIRSRGDVDEAEMRRVFNMGLGFLLVSAPEHAGRLADRLVQSGHTVYRVGEIVAGDGLVRFEGGPS